MCGLDCLQSHFLASEQDTWGGIKLTRSRKRAGGAGLFMKVLGGTSVPLSPPSVQLAERHQTELSMNLANIVHPDLESP